MQVLMLENSTGAAIYGGAIYGGAIYGGAIFNRGKKGCNYMGVRFPIAE